MATDTRSIPQQNLSSDANFRAWGDAISKCLDAGGLNKSTDTGQIDWTTVTRPAAGAYGGYEIWKLATDTKFNDLGLFIKIEYGCGSTQTWATIAVTVGTATDGAGTLTGTVGTRRELKATATSSAAFDAYCCSIDGTAIAILPFRATSAGNSNFTIHVERLRDNNGAVTADGIYTMIQGPFTTGTNALYAEIIRNGSVTPNVIADRLGAFVNNNTGNYLTDYYMATHHPADRHTLYNPCLANLFYYHSDLTAGVNITVSRYGTNRTYKPLGQLPSSGSYTAAFGHGNGGIAILWE